MAGKFDGSISSPFTWEMNATGSYFPPKVEWLELPPPGVASLKLKSEGFSVDRTFSFAGVDFNVKAAFKAWNDWSLIGSATSKGGSANLDFPYGPGSFRAASVTVNPGSVYLELRPNQSPILEISGGGSLTINADPSGLIIKPWSGSINISKYRVGQSLEYQHPIDVWDPRYPLQTMRHYINVKVF